ncbi:MAG: sulfotransferase [Gemmatimonadetes bacterium]|nr:sulfotransferase [Gemmatimonadota bacterium]MYH18397.1 sulfotransferase [Gemmatimonadota bacterium]MYK99550.1 sulfotransferase [Gemmatimonadota bacterium]
MPRQDFRNRPIEEVKALLDSQRGLLPLELHCDNREITWFDFGDMHLRETFLEISAEERLSQHADALTVVTDFDVLETPDLYVDALAPSGFIFHVGRCGSTLLAKVLSSLDRHIVIKEAEPVQQLLGVEYEEAFRDHRASFFQSLLNIYGHKRLPEHERFFVKFSSNHVKRLEMIRGLYPGVPWLFLYRNPYEIIPTLLEGPAWFIRNKNTPEGAFDAGLPIEAIERMSDLAFSVRVESSTLRIAIENTCDHCLFVDYTQLKPENLPRILRFFGLKVTREDYNKMFEPFGFYSKRDGESVPFVPDSAAKRDKVTDEIREAIEEELWDLYQSLHHSERNLERVYS